jgi:hypothetical protein
MMLATRTARVLKYRAKLGVTSQMIPASNRAVPACRRPIGAPSNLRGFASASAPPSDDSPAEVIPEDESPTSTNTTLPESSVNELKDNLRPSQVVHELDQHIVGQADAKKAVAIAMRNRWRRRQLPDSLRKEVTPRNVLLVGPTGCGKTGKYSAKYYLDVGCLTMLLPEHN